MALASRRRQSAGAATCWTSSIRLTRPLAMKRSLVRLADGDEMTLRLVVTYGIPAEALHRSLGFARVPDPR
jgi:hypothetical protein